MVNHLNVGDLSQFNGKFAKPGSKTNEFYGKSFKKRNCETKNNLDIYFYLKRVLNTLNV